MTSQVTTSPAALETHVSEKCQPPADAPKDYCRKLKSGISRLETNIRLEYEETFPAGGEWIANAIREAREAAWSTPYPSLFFPALAHLRVNERMPSA
ncbi:MAG: hypothetical protein H0V54_15435 [Chthoniobacterales bacterium]|nr:hypothetical protein [Chthoniobacterales bacterium]